MKATANWMHSMSLGWFSGYMALVGAGAGLVAWTMVLIGHFAFDIERPTVVALLLAIPRGALFAVILGLCLRVYWKRRNWGGTPDR